MLCDNLGLEPLYCHERTRSAVRPGHSAAWVVYFDLRAFPVGRAQPTTACRKSPPSAGGHGNRLLVDIVKEGFNAGIRLGERLSQGVVAVRIKPRLRMAVVGSPRYFQSRTPPKAPAELHNHQCIRYRFPSGAIYHWEFERRGEAGGRGLRSSDTG